MGRVFVHFIIKIDLLRIKISFEFHTHVQLASNPIGDDGMIALSKAAKLNPAIKLLSIQVNTEVSTIIPYIFKQDAEHVIIAIFIVSHYYYRKSLHHYVATVILVKILSG